MSCTSSTSRRRPVSQPSRRRRPQPPRADLAIGAFSDDGPWIVDLERISVAGRGARGAAAPSPPRAARARPPADGAARASGSSRVARHLGVAVGRLGPASSRRPGRLGVACGLSRRLRMAAEALGPTYIKLGQIISLGRGHLPRGARRRVQEVPRPGAARAVRVVRAGGRGGPRPAARGGVLVASTASRWPPRRSPRSTAPRCAPARTSW